MKSFAGELIGTFILVFLGCGIVAWAVFIEPLSLTTVAIVWGLAVTLAIYSSSPLSKAHLNPAVSIGFLVHKSIGLRELIPYLLGQFVGALAAAVLLHLLFSNQMTFTSVEDALMFGEYYPNPSNSNLEHLSGGMAFLAEMTGTFFLMLGILLIIRFNGRGSKVVNPALIGVLLTILIYIFAPFTQAGFNPARDFSPRLYSYFAGFQDAFSYNDLGWLTVYILGPVVGAVFAVLIDRLLPQKRRVH